MEQSKQKVKFNNGFALTPSKGVTLQSKEGFTRQNFSKKNLGGFTLTELLIVILFLGVLSITAGGLYISQSRLTKTEFKLTQNQAELAVSLNTVTPYLAAANNLLASINLNGVDYQLTDQTLIWTLPAKDINGNSILNQNDTGILTLNGDKILFILEPSIDSTRSYWERPLLESVTNFNVEYQNTTIIEDSFWVNLHLEKEVQLQSTLKTVSHELKTYFRNQF